VPVPESESAGFYQLWLANACLSAGRMIHQTDLVTGGLVVDLNQLLANARRNEALLKRLQAYELELLACQSWADWLRCLLERLPRQFELDAIEVSLIDGDEKLRQSMHHSLDVDQAALLQGVNFDAESVSAEVQVMASAAPYQSGLELPLQRNQRQLGQLRLFSHQPERFQAGMAMDFMQHLAAVVAACLELVHKTEVQARLALTDPLTGAENRRGFERAFQREWARGQRQYHVFALVLLDLDHFKRINDQHGHACGDRVLTGLCQAVQRLLRPTDHLGRLGGEEFVIMLPGCQASELGEVVRRLQAAIHALNLHTDQGQPLAISASGSYLTVTPRAHHKARLDDYLQHLDGWLYKAKQQGRDCFLAAQQGERC
jgi:diguanylate cyclase (GGDEF)-like protein